MKQTFTLLLICVAFFSFSCQDEHNINSNKEPQRTTYNIPDASPAIQQILQENRIDGVINHLFSIKILKDYYSQHDYKPAWTNIENIEDALKAFEDLYDDGLNPEDYHLTILRKMNQTFVSEQDIDSLEFAKFDVLLSESYIKAASHLISGKVNPESLEQAWEVEPENYKLVIPNPIKSFETALSDHKTYELIDKLKPTHYMYTGLKKALKEFRSYKEKDDWDSIPDGETIKPGTKSSRVVAVRARLMASQEMEAYIPVNDSVYDSVLSVNIAHFQKKYGIDVDGNVGKQTLYELNIPLDYRIEQIKANLERARWVLYNIEDKFIAVNIAGFELYIIENGKEVLTSRVIVGKEHTKSPIFKAHMQYVVINPTWTVPRSLYPGYINKLKHTPDYFAKKNMEIITKDGQHVDIASTDWSKYNIHNFPYMIRQKSGSNNALGYIKCMFPNKHSVYIHDTPSRSLFNKDTRAFSHGCIRTQKIRDVALWLLELNNDDWSKDRINDIIKQQKTTTINLKEKVPVLILYWTAGIGFHDNFYFKPDIYKRDKVLIDALNTIID